MFDPATLFPPLLALIPLLLLLSLLFLLRADCDLFTYFSRVSPRPFRGKVAWVTGASSGIGLALAHRLAREGVLLILSSRRLDALEAVRDTLPCPPGAVALLPLDLSAGPAAIALAAARAPELHGRLDYLFNNAGISQRSSAEDLPPAHVHAILNVNFLSHAALARACLPALRAAPAGAATIVNTLSIAAIVHTPLRSAYCASKAAAAAYFNCLHLEQPRLRVLNVFPGSVRTAIARNALAKDGKLYARTDPNIENGLDPDRVADRILAAVSAGLYSTWIARPKELNVTRIASAFPTLWRYISFRLADGYRRNIDNAPVLTTEDNTDKNKDA